MVCEPTGRLVHCRPGTRTSLAHHEDVLAGAFEFDSESFHLGLAGDYRHSVVALGALGYHLKQSITCLGALDALVAVSAKSHSGIAPLVHCGTFVTVAVVLFALTITEGSEVLNDVVGFVQAYTVVVGGASNMAADIGAHETNFEPIGFDKAGDSIAPLEPVHHLVHRIGYGAVLDAPVTVPTNLHKSGARLVHVGTFT